MELEWGCLYLGGYDDVEFFEFKFEFFFFEEGCLNFFVVLYWGVLLKDYMKIDKLLESSLSSLSSLVMEGDIYIMGYLLGVVLVLLIGKMLVVEEN